MMMDPAPVLAGLSWSWARLELAWVATVSTTMTYEGKILLIVKIMAWLIS